MKAWWESLNEREQKLVTYGGFALLVAIFYWGIWTPVGNALEKNQQQLVRQQNTNQWARDAINQIQLNSGSHRNSGSLQQIVNQTSRQFNVQIGRMNPKGEQLNLLIEEIVFNDLLRWLSHLEQNQGVKIMTLDVSETETPGKVRVPRLIIEKA